MRAIEELLETVDGFDLVSVFVFNLWPVKPDNLITPGRVVDAVPGAVSGMNVVHFAQNRDETGNDSMVHFLFKFRSLRYDLLN